MTVSNLSNKGAAGVPYYTPEQDPPAGTALEPESAPTLFQPLRMRSVQLHNRFVVSPMCMYSADDGHLSDFHLVHLGQFAMRGAALTFVEATAVQACGRISPQDSGLWKDSQIAPLKRITDFVHSQGTKAAIQLAHAGRKASTLAPWLRAERPTAGLEHGGWEDVVGPSAIPYDKGYPDVVELTVDDIKKVVQDFADAAVRAVKAGFDVIEIHGAHGYLNTSFMSPLSNKRTDEYGGSFENRTRIVTEIIAVTRAVIPEDMPLWLRISATEWMEWTGQPSWDINESIRLAKLLPGLGVDVLDVSSGGNNPQQRIDFHPRYQTDIAGQIRRAVRAEGLDLHIAAVGAITGAQQARSLVQAGGGGATSNGTAADGGVEMRGENGQAEVADLVLAAKQFLREPEWVLRAAHDINVPVQWPHQYGRAPLPMTGKF